jgi:hypothetical protein
MPGTKTWEVITTNDEPDIDRTTYAMQVPGGVIIRHEMMVALPSGAATESMAFVPGAKLIEFAPTLWAVFSEHLTSVQPRTLPA